MEKLSWSKWPIMRSILMIACSFLLASMAASAERRTLTFQNSNSASQSDPLSRVLNFLWKSDQSGYHHVWPVNDTNVILNFVKRRGKEPLNSIFKRCDFVHESENLSFRCFNESECASFLESFLCVSGFWHILFILYQTCMMHNGEFWEICSSMNQ